MKKNKASIAIVLFLIFAMAISLFALPTVDADEPLRRKTYAFIGANPNPIGVGQETVLHVGILDPAGTRLDNPGWHGLSVTITRPDGTTETIRDISTDTTGGTGRVYVPTTAGNYTLQTHFPEQVAPWAQRGIPAGTIYEASDSPIEVLVVTEEPRERWPGVPLPTEYWTRPIDAQFREWSDIAGSVLHYTQGTTVEPHSTVVPYTTGPETAHILWARRIAQGLEYGLVGGEHGDHSYGPASRHAFLPAITMGGVLYTNRYISTGGVAVEQEVVAVDLRTGEELWVRPLLDPDGVNRRLSFGQQMWFFGTHYHSVEGYLWVTVGSTWHAFDPWNGRWLWTLTNVPSGNNIYGPSGEILRYTINLAQSWMTLWNTSAIRWPVDSYPTTWSVAGRTDDARLGIQWNVTIPTGLPGAVRKIRDGIIIGSNYHRGTPAPATNVHWGISTVPGDEGRLLFNRTWALPFEDVHMNIEDVSVEDGVFVVAVSETGQHFGFSTITGERLWGPTEGQIYLDRYSFASGNNWDVAYDGKYFSGGVGGTIYCYDIKTGALLWTYKHVDEYAEHTFAPDFPVQVVLIADGKVYVEYNEHSPFQPLRRGAPFAAVDIETGEEIWRIKYHGSSERSGGPVIGDGVIAAYNNYDGLVYAFGKGPSATTITASPKISTHGNNVLVEGMVTDISPGTDDFALQKRFPNGVTAVADESMTDWMEYVYMQFPRPTDVVGVEVVVSVLDPNNNYYEVGRTTAYADGTFGLAFEPEVPGLYQVIATFEGSKSYYGSQATTYLNVEEAPAVAAPTPPPESIADVYLVPGIVGIIVAIAIVGALVLLALRKR